KEFVTIDSRDQSRHPPPDVGPASAQGGPWAAAGSTAAEGMGGAEAGEASGGDGRARAAWMSDPDLPPPQGCERHPNNTGLIPCGPCGGARKIHAAFISGEITHAEAVAAWTRSPRAREDSEE